MQYCNNCKVHVRGNKKICPLCQNRLPNYKEDLQDQDIFPQIPPSYEGHLALRLMIFISVVIIVVSFAIYLIFPTRINWPILIIFAIISMWVSLIVVIKKRHNIPKTIIWLVGIVSLLSLFWDWRTGWHGWALDYAIPS